MKKLDFVESDFWSWKNSRPRPSDQLLAVVVVVVVVAVVAVVAVVVVDGVSFNERLLSDQTCFDSEQVFLLVR